MQTNNILSAPLIDIIFDGRNKDYGAYELRKHYSQRIGRALLVTGIIMAFVFGSTVLAGSMKRKPPKVIITEHVLESVADKPKPKLPDPPKQPETKPVQTIKYVTFKMVDKPVVDPPPQVSNLDSSVIGLTDKKGIVDPYGTPAPDTIFKKGIIDVQPRNDADAIVETIDVDAKYPGDWKRFLEKNLNPEVPVQNEAPSGRYSVVIRFVVDRDGNVSDIVALTEHGYGMEQEAIRVIKKATKWEPAFLNGMHVKAYRKQVIVFEVTE
jgi:protein TonB